MCSNTRSPPFAFELLEGLLLVPPFAGYGAAGALILGEDDEPAAQSYRDIVFSMVANIFLVAYTGMLILYAALVSRFEGR